MMTVLKLGGRLRRGDDGATAIEYALLAALIAAVIVTGVASLGGAVGGLYEEVESELVAATQ